MSFSTSMMKAEHKSEFGIMKGNPIFHHHFNGVLVQDGNNLIADALAVLHQAINMQAMGNLL